MPNMTLERTNELCQKLERELQKKIIGQKHIVRFLTISLFSKGHTLLIGVPGLAKTLLVKSLAESLQLNFKRIQFTPDLMPSDIIGTEIIQDFNGKLSFEFKQGPIFTNLLLADEINRTPPKTQSALLEAMQERCVTVAGNTRILTDPFMVVATQNPIEQEGTYPLPEAQLDRFMLSLELSYPSREEEIEIVHRTTSEGGVNINAVISSEELLEIQSIIRAVPISQHIVEYAVDLVGATRPENKDASKTAKEYIEWGAGPRASQNLILAAKVNAILKGKATPETEDIREVAVAVLQHRIVPNYKASGSGIVPSAIVQEIIKTVKESNYNE
jgi:MoxR-like ATPase